MYANLSLVTTGKWAICNANCMLYFKLISHKCACIVPPTENCPSLLMQFFASGTKGFPVFINACVINSLYFFFSWKSLEHQSRHNTSNYHDDNQINQPPNNCANRFVLLHRSSSPKQRSQPIDDRLPLSGLIMSVARYWSNRNQLSGNHIQLFLCVKYFPRWNKTACSYDKPG